MNAATSRHEALHLRFGSVKCCVSAPAAAATPLRSIFARHLARASDADIYVSIDAIGSRWHVSSSLESRTEFVLATQSVLAVARALVGILETPLAARMDATTESGVVLSLNGEAAMFRGAADGELFVLVAHLTARGWKVVATATSFADQAGRVSGIQQLLSARPSMLPQVPVIYRGAIETSPWYVARNGIYFYAVDPGRAVGAGVWNEWALRRASIRIVQATSFQPEIKAEERVGTRRHQAVWKATLELGDPIATADLFENWWHADVSNEAHVSALT